VVKVMHENGAKVRKLLAEVIPVVAAHEGECTYGCDRALEHAIMTTPGAADPELVKKLDAVAGRVLGRFT